MLLSGLPDLTAEMFYLRLSNAGNPKSSFEIKLEYPPRSTQAKSLIHTNEKQKD